MLLPVFNSCLDIVEDFKYVSLLSQGNVDLMLGFEEN